MLRYGYDRKLACDAIPLEKILRGIGWFLFMEFVTLVLLILVPQLSLFLPNLMMGR